MARSPTLREDAWPEAASGLHTATADRPTDPIGAADGRVAGGNHHGVAIVVEGDAALAVDQQAVECHAEPPGDRRGPEHRGRQRIVGGIDGRTSGPSPGEIGLGAHDHGAELVIDARYAT